MLSHPQVLPVHRLARRVGHEAHRLKGFVRFREVGERFWYAAVEPDHDVLGLIAPHFAERFRDQHWVIHDLRRNKGIVHDADRRHWIEVEMERCSEPELSREEEMFQTLWRRYFTETAIAFRHNPRLQWNKVPRRYRRHLT
jgi:probable DNA metabolism protein